MRYLISLSLSLGALSLAPLTASAGISAGTKSVSGSSGSGIVATKEEMQEARAKQAAEKKAKDDLLILNPGTLKDIYKQLSQRTDIPGFATLRANRSLGTIVGPDSKQNFGFQVNSIIYIRWRGSIRPEIGETYAVYNPLVILQSRVDFTDFKVRKNKFEAKEDLNQFDHAGYLYESNGEIEIVDISRGVVKARVINNLGSIYLKDQVMAPFPRLSTITPIESPIRMTAAVVAGYPYEKLSSSMGNFLYLNRGKRDGVKVGTVFQTLEAVNLLDSDPIKKNHDLGEVMVVYASDAYSTAIITKQFDMLRIGSLLETVRPGLDREAQYNVLSAKVTNGKAKAAADESDRLMSELDRIEKDSDILSLSPEERERLERLHQQELRRRQAGTAFPNSGESEALPAPNIADGGAPALPAPPDIAAARKQREDARKRRMKQRKDELRKRDEEKLNSLFSE